MQPDCQQLTQEALDAFWECITKRFPQAKTGDLTPVVLSGLTEAAESAVTEWVCANVRRSNRTKAAPVTQAESTHTPGPWTVSGITAVCARYGIVSLAPSEFIASVGLLDDPKRTDYGNARLIAAAPDLRAMVQTAKSAFGERLSCLRDERREVLRFDGDAEDIDDQIGHYEALVRQCNTVLEKTAAG